MKKTLVILEVSKKQDYIFSSKKLRDNVARSDIIRYVTSPEFFMSAAPSLYGEQNLVYSGGGHTIVQFEDPETAREFSALVTETAMREFDGLELFVKQMPYGEDLNPGENLKELSAALERKKSLRSSGFRQVTFGADLPGKIPSRESPCSGLSAPEGWAFMSNFSDLAGSGNFLSVVHIDGNAMGQRVQNIYDANTADWESCCRALRRFSSSIQSDFEAAFLAMTQDLIARADHLEIEGSALPVRPVILAGDDVCFVCRGDLGLECARSFIEHLTALTNSQDGQPYACCAGVAMVHQKYPFHRAYDLSEALCSSAKRFGAETDRRISCIDWHIEFGQLKESLSALREDYETDDHNRMELRPLAVVVPEDIPMTEELQVRSYDFFRQMWRGLRGEAGKIARGKVKELRNAIKQGQVETDYFLEDREASQLVEHTFAAQYRTAQRQTEKLRSILEGESQGFHQAFMELGDRKRCLLFDAIEMIDHYTDFEEV